MGNTGIKLGYLKWDDEIQVFQDAAGLILTKENTLFVVNAQRNNKTLYFKDFNDDLTD